jgi:hypothetical protein
LLATMSEKNGRGGMPFAGAPKFWIRVEIDGVVLFMKCVHYGAGSWDPNRYLVKIRNANGAVLSWFTSSGRYIEGDPMKGTAKIKKHEEFRGEKSTVIGNFRAVKGA